MSDEWIWISRWEEFQSYQRKRGKVWAPPWIKTYVAQVNDHRYLELTDRQRALLHDLRMLFPVTGARLSRDTSVISRHRQRQTFRSDLQALEDAGFIEVCSGTVLEQRRNTLWNGSTLEVEVEVEEKKPLHVKSKTKPVCPHCKLELSGPLKLAEHIYLQHDGPEPAHWLEAETKAVF